VFFGFFTCFSGICLIVTFHKKQKTNTTFSKLVTTNKMNTNIFNIGDTTTNGKENDSTQPSLHGKVCTLSAISFATTVLTFEGIPLANLLKRKRFKPVYVHHVVLCPLEAQTITNVYTTPYSLAPCWVMASKVALKMPCYISGTTVPMLRMEEFLSEIAYRKKYGPIANLHWMLLATKLMSCPVEWQLVRETMYHHHNPVTMAAYSFTLPLNSDKDLEKECTRTYLVKLNETLAHMCKKFEPIFID